MVGKLITNQYVNFIIAIHVASQSIAIKFKLRDMLEFKIQIR